MFGHGCSQMVRACTLSDWSSWKGSLACNPIHSWSKLFWVPSPPTVSLPSPRQEIRHLKQVGQSIDDTKSPEEVAYLSGPRVAIHAHLAHSVLQRKTVEPDFMERIAFAAEQVFPLASGDLSHRFKGKALGDKLNDLKWDWIRSNFTLNKKSLLERAI